MVGVTLIEKPQDVVLEFTSTRAPYHLSKPFIPELISQKTMKNGNVRISYLLYINNELIQQILSFGSDITVIKPKALREKVSTILKSALEKYE
jgi:predicted DNA-binding transcriptional regulator YafY